MPSRKPSPETGGDLISLLVADRSIPDRAGEPPDVTLLSTILSVATTVPDHGGLRPWRFVVIQGHGRDAFGDALVAGLFAERGAGLPEAVVTKMRSKAFAAPCQIMLVAAPVEGSNVPVWEQVASASCTGYAIVLAATAVGLGAIWKSAQVLHAEPVRKLFGVTGGEQLLGWVNLGKPAGPSDRELRLHETIEFSPFVSTLDSDDRRPWPTTEPDQ